MIKKDLVNDNLLMDGKINAQNISENSYLKNYYQRIQQVSKIDLSPSGHVTEDQEITTGQQMRILEIAFKKGFTINSFGNVGQKLRFEFQNKFNVPISASINGVEIKISLDDYTEAEKSIVALENESKKISSEKSADTKDKSSDMGVRGSKEVDF